MQARIVRNSCLLNYAEIAGIEVKMMSYLMGIDIGTSGTKTVLFDTEGRVVGSAFEEYPLSQPRPGWAEQDPEDWWRAVRESIRRVLNETQVAPGKVRGIGLSGQMHGAVLLDRGYKVLRPAIIWCDQRSARQCEWIEDKIGKERLIDLTCNPALTGFTAPKVLWVRDNEPRIFDAIRKILLPKDYIRFKLTGEFASEVSDASGTLFFDVKGRKWSDEVLSELGIARELLPEVFESPVVSGKVTAKVAEETGLAEGTPVVGGGGDQAAGAVGNGIVESGVISSTIGTSGVVFAFSSGVKIDPKGRVHTFCHAVPGRWHVMGVTQGAGLSYRWFRDNFASAEREIGEATGIDPYDLLGREAERVAPGCEGLIFLPYLMGERTPHLDPNAKGVFFGLTARHTRSHVIRSIMEGVIYSLRDSLEILKELGVPVSQVRASGGGARSQLWRQMQADIFNSEIVTINATEGPAFGVALLAGVGTGVYNSVEEACAATIKVVTRLTPLKENVKRYDEYYEVYRSLYGTLKAHFERVTGIVNKYI